jgi:2-oxoglutarate dehydrogenase E2 component (dihydrolipoamide succinyltransferase)
MDVTIPAVGESITSGLISTWHKKDGDTVQPGDVLLTLETDKVSTEITAEKAGVLRIKAPEGQEVKIGEVVAVIEEGFSRRKEKSAQARRSARPGRRPGTRAHTGSCAHPGAPRTRCRRGVTRARS